MATEPRAYPRNDAGPRTPILGIPNFQCTNFTHALHAGGAVKSHPRCGGRTGLRHSLDDKLVIDYPKTGAKGVASCLRDRGCCR